MNLTDAPLGYAFEGDYPESYGSELLRLRTIVAQQVVRLADTRPSAEGRLLGVLIGRRSSDRERAQIEVALRRDGAPSLLARGELLISAKDLAAVGALVQDYGDRTVGDHVRLRRFAAGRVELDRVIDDCAVHNIAAHPNYIASMAAVGKGVGGPENAPWLGDFANYRIPNAPSDGGPGPRPPVAVIDTGVEETMRGDHWLGKVTRTPENLDLLDVLPRGGDGFLDYEAGHGTFVAGVVQRVAPSADIRVYRAADTDGFATDDDIAAAIVQAHRDGAEIINLSLGGKTLDDQPPLLMQQAVETVHAEAGRDSKGRFNKVIVAAAGNYGDRGIVWPAALDGVEAVAGLTAYLSPASWSSYGAVRFSTVGEGIRSVYPEGAESPLFDPEPDTFGPNAAAVWSGTSFAAPQIAGAVARISAEQNVSPRDAVDLLDARGKSVVGFGKAMRILQGIG
ncbi:subtilisin family serine protease [Krasilnikovia cinnamomea]|uniref:Subtilisin family serine protease n=1 Tax=Krasilnikovia cinnamomea TaxID=349313 RepID=A0A4Q7ZEH0_9ACTN|nr:S8/S53 family peptidase [Krasilnikovia cinnamomea]RZU48513.1 subtilisin family serine protease [Krasilnikovia cinnamomea]